MSFESGAKGKNRRIKKQIKSLPGLVSVRLQLALIGEIGPQSEEIQEQLRGDVIRYVASCGAHVRVMVFWEPDADITWAGQGYKRLPGKDWPNWTESIATPPIS